MNNEPITKCWLHKAKVQKHFLFSLLPTIYPLPNLANFTYFEKLDTSKRNVVTRHHILVKGSSQKGAPYMLPHSIHYELNMS